MTHPAQSPPVGLTQTEAAARLAAEGPNELPKALRRSPLRIIVDVLKEPMLTLLLAGGVVYLLLGNREEALILLAFACLSVGITVVQEARTERVLEALRIPIFVGGQDCFVSGSVGIALFPRDGDSVADLMRNADMAMYTVKGQGRNASALFSPALAGQGRER
ncbi:MAG: diguanylate cyclase, partial [Rhodobacterales bacterium]